MENREHDSDKYVEVDKTADKSNDDIDYRNYIKYTDNNTDDCSNNQLNNYVDNKRCYNSVRISIEMSIFSIIIH